MLVLLGQACVILRRLMRLQLRCSDNIQHFTCSRKSCARGVRGGMFQGQRVQRGGKGMVSLPPFINLSLPLGLSSSPYIHRRLWSPCTCPPHTRRRTCSRPNPHLHILHYTARLQADVSKIVERQRRRKLKERGAEGKNLAGV